MENSSTVSEKLWIGFGIITTVCGIILTLDNPLIGIPGTIVGIWLITTNVKKLKK